MYAIDRFMLAGYSIDSMNSAVVAGAFVEPFAYMFIGLVATAEIFVGQYNGAKDYDKLAAPTWQMIYFLLALIVFFCPIAYFSDHLNMLPEYFKSEGVIYQKILMYFLPLSLIKISFSTFFVGQGKTKILTFATATGAIINIGLDYVFIYVYGMGCKGAAIATVIAKFIPVLIFASVFFNRENRRAFNTLQNCRFNKKLSLECIIIGFPLAFGSFITLVAWYFVQAAANNVSKDAATVFNIGVSTYKIFVSAAMALEKSSSAICANMIGANDLKSVEKSYRIFIGISLLVGFLAGACLIVSPEWILHLLDVLPDNLSALYDEIRIMFCVIAVSITLEAILCSTWGILVAGGDTKYAMMIYLICLWVFTVIPTAILHYFHMLHHVQLIFGFMSICCFVSWLLLHRRYKSLKWYNKLV
jgi:MATE family multidrug resistance protein